MGTMPLTPAAQQAATADELELEINPCPSVARAFAHALLYVVQVIWFIFQYLGFPWMYLALPLWQQEPTKQSVLLAEIIVGLSYPVNVVAVLGTLHYNGTISQFQAWEAGIVGWTVGMMTLRIGLGLYSRAAVVAGKDSEVAEREFDQMLIRPFGLKVSRAAAPHAWTKPLLVLLFAQAFYVLASWCLNPHTTIECFAVNSDTKDAMQEITWKPHDNNSIPVMWKPTSSTVCNPPLLFAANLQSCCRVNENTFDLTSFLADIGGNAVVGYWAVKYVGIFLKWNTLKRTDSKKEDDVPEI
jgi:hypothetical protein